MSDIDKQLILELFLNGDDKRMRIIGSIVGFSETHVGNVVDAYFDKKIEFKDTGFILLHSKINYEDEL